jgi:DNA invertase Pin-like site-specific DNA recombinase
MMRAYARVSTDAQDLAVQIAELIAAGVNPKHLYQDKATGKNADRPGLKRLLREVESGDVVVVFKVDRISRSVRDLMNLSHDFAERGVELRSLHDPIDTTTAMGRSFFQMVAVFAELERSLVLSRTAAGRDFALAEDKRLKRPSRFGRRPKLSARQLDLARALLKDGEHDLAGAAALLGVHRTTLFRYLGQDGKRTR